MEVSQDLILSFLIKRLQNGKTYSKISHTPNSQKPTHEILVAILSALTSREEDRRRGKDPLDGAKRMTAKATKISPKRKPMDDLRTITSRSNGQTGKLRPALGIDEKEKIPQRRQAGSSLEILD